LTNGAVLCPEGLQQCHRPFGKPVTQKSPKIRVCFIQAHKLLS